MSNSVVETLNKLSWDLPVIEIIVNAVFELRGSEKGLGCIFSMGAYYDNLLQIWG